MKNILVVITAILSALYLLNPTAGFFEIIPDNIPLVGNLDEAAATALLVACMQFFGYDITRFLGQKKKGKTQRSSDVVDID